MPAAATDTERPASHGLVAHLATFAAALRRRGIRVGLSDEIDAVEALEHLDLLDRLEVRRGLRIALKVPHEAWAEFDRLFDEHWGGAAPIDVPVPPPGDPARSLRPMQWRWDGTRVRLEVPEPEPTPDASPAYSADALLRRKAFDSIAPHEIAALERSLQRLAQRLAARRSRRLVPTRGRGAVDLRRSFRHALATRGDFLRLARRTRARDEPRLVLLYDTSGSMDPHTRLHLSFAFALRRVIRNVEIFAFNTSLTRVTRAIDPVRVPRSVERLGAEVPDWSGGTRIGACLAAFVAAHPDILGRETTVVIVSDGLDLGDTTQLVAAMRALRARAATIVWLNPLLADRRYEPSAAGMQAALPFVDHFGPAHNLESIERLLRLIG
ncbi:MAG TPA: VWA domain-containing protein [Burkholderiaceae bacterium]|nr:VWA domain-containing protein [Burkholderiaceae bacterium]